MATYDKKLVKNYLDAHAKAQAEWDKYGRNVYVPLNLDISFRNGGYKIVNYDRSAGTADVVKDGSRVCTYTERYSARKVCGCYPHISPAIVWA